MLSVMEREGSREKFCGGDVSEQVVLALRRLIRATDLHSRSLIARYGLTLPQLAVLEALSHHGSLAVSELTKAVHLSQATVTGILDRLEKRFLIERHRSDTDKRRVMVRLTPGGEKILSRRPPHLQEHFVSEFAKLQDWEQTQILSSLQRLAGMMEAGPLKDGPVFPGARTEMPAEPVGASPCWAHPGVAPGGSGAGTPARPHTSKGENSEPQTGA